MLGLIKKDLLIVKSNIKMLVIMIFVFFVMTLQGEFDTSFILPFIICTMFISTFSYDEYNKWDAYVITLPNGRKNAVKSKYIASIILTLLSIVITILINCLIGIIGNSLTFDKFISTLIGSVFAISIIQTIMYPLIFKYGIEKGRIGLFVLTFAIVGIIELFSKTIKVNIPTSIISFFNSYWFIILLVVIIVCLFISYKVSEKIYSKKEF